MDNECCIKHPCTIILKDWCFVLVAQISKEKSNKGKMHFKFDTARLNPERLQQLPGAHETVFSHAQ